MVVPIMPYKLSAFGLSDIGLVRQNNEDYWSELPKLNFFILADGMGGHRAGEVAAKEAVEAVCKVIENAFSIEPNLNLEEAYGVVQYAIEQSNEAVYRRGRQDRDLRGMGTTLCTLLFHPKGLIYAHVGDSRIYRMRNFKLEQITSDHSLLRELVDLGQLNDKQVTDFLYKNIITKAVGTEPFVEPTVQFAEVFPEDVYLICSDGLSDMLSEHDIEVIINRGGSVEEVGKELVRSANERGGYDNITVVLIKVQEIQ